MRTIDGHCLCQEGVIQKLHESHHFICSHPFEKKNLSQEPIGQQQQSLGINNVETETAHKREKRATAGVSVAWFHLVNSFGISCKAQRAKQE